MGNVGAICMYSECVHLFLLVLCVVVIGPLGSMLDVGRRPSYHLLHA